MNRKREDENGQKQKKKKIGIIAAVLLGGLCTGHVAYAVSFRWIFRKSGKK